MTLRKVICDMVAEHAISIAKTRMLRLSGLGDVADPSGLVPPLQTLTGPSLVASVHTPVFFGKVAGQIAGVMENAPHLDHTFTAAPTQNKMTRRLHAWAGFAAPASPICATATCSRIGPGTLASRTAATSAILCSCPQAYTATALAHRLGKPPAIYVTNCLAMG